MRINKVLIAVENKRLFNELNIFFVGLGFHVVSDGLQKVVLEKNEISFFIVDIPGAKRLLSHIVLQKEHVETVVPALIFLSDGENPVYWLEAGFDDYFFQNDPSRLYFSKLKKWVSLQQGWKNTLENQQSLLNIVAQSLKSPVVIINQNGTIAAINQVAVDLFGLDIEKIIGGHWTLFAPQEYQEQLLKVYNGVLNGKAPETKSFEFTFKDKLNRERVWQVTIDVNPVSKKFVVIMQDMEPVKEFQRASYQSEQKFLSAVESVDVAFSATTIGGVFVDVNSSFLKSLGYKRDEVIGKNVTDLSIWKNITDREKYVTALLKNGEVKEMKVDFKSKSGQLINGILSGRIVLLNNEKYIFSSVKDVTEIKNYQASSRILQKIKDSVVGNSDKKSLFLTIYNELRSYHWFDDAEFLLFIREDDLIYKFKNNNIVKCESCNLHTLLLQQIADDTSEISFNAAEIRDVVDLKGITISNELPRFWITFPLRTAKRFYGNLIVSCKTENLKTNKQALNLVSNVARDMSLFLEEKKMEGELVVIQHALNSAASAVVITDIDGNIIWVNKAFTTLTGYSFEEALGQNPRLLKSGKHPERFYKNLWDTILSGKVWKSELINKRKNGTLYHEENTITPVFDANGKISRFIAIKQDITERKKFEDSLKYHLSRQQMLNNILSYYITENAAGLERIVNYYLAEIGTFVKAQKMCLVEYDADKPDWSNMYQWSADGDARPVLGGLNGNEIKLVKDWFLLKVEKSVRMCSFSLDNIDDEGIKNIFVRKNIGTLICFPLFHESRRIGFSGFIFSMANYTMADDEVSLMDIFSYIFINIWLRNTSVIELENAKRSAEEAIRLKTAFLANMNHEIRTPMNAVMGFSDLMAEASCEEKDEYAKIILSSARQLLKLVDNVIFLSRLQSERLPVTLTQCKPAEIVESVFQIFLVSDENVNNLDIRMSYAGKLKDFAFLSDLDKIQQVLTNFVSNALKYTLSGYVEIGFSVEKDTVRFYVKDTGKGIAQDEVPKIFDAFYRSSDVMFSSIRGSGLGLNIAKELVETMGGEIGVNTELNRGSEFYFTLPFKPLKKDNKKKLKSAAPERWNDLRVLVAEDNEDSFLYLQILLEKRVKKLDHAIDGLQAVKMAMDNDYDLILMDIKMPEIDGLEATRHIKLKKPGVVIIAQTAYAMPEEKEQALGFGCDGYVTKPVKKELLFEIIEKKVLKNK